MRHHEIEPVGPPGDGPPYAVALGWTPSRTRPPAMCRAGYMVSLLWWRTNGPRTSQVETTTRRAMKSPTTGQRVGRNGRALFMVAPVSLIDDEQLEALRARALELSERVAREVMGHANPLDPYVLDLPEGARLVAPGEVWGTWAAWCHIPNREGAGR